MSVADLLKSARLHGSHVYHAVLDVARGLQYIHAQAILHRDLKCDNVMLTADGVARVVDFGLARVKSSASSVATRGGGALRWRAPELFRDAPYTQACDVYSFAMLVVQLVSGAVPWIDLRSDEAVMMAVCFDKKPPSAQLPGDMNPTLRGVLE